MGGRLSGKVALITGSTSGIGRATAIRFAQEGAALVLNDEGTDRAEEAIRRVQEAGGEVHYIAADVRDPEAVRRLVAGAIERFGRLDVLMNNAYSGRGGSVTEVDVADWDAVFSVSVRAAYLASKYAIPQMQQQGGGSIIHVASVHGLLAAVGNPAYAASKAALIQLARQMAVEYGPYGIRVNALCPGWIVTERHRPALERSPNWGRRERWIYPLGRPGRLEEAANAALFLASEESSFVTGHALVVDGGLTAQLQDNLAARLERALRELEES
ncbi:MAG: short chain dehydrogenase [Candidatus Poribacteria bacterium]|nr:MAG: short chain dehydrogenase [Candidatus Poribacteria bacterium]